GSEDPSRHGQQEFPAKSAAFMIRNIHAAKDERDDDRIATFVGLQIGGEILEFAWISSNRGSESCRNRPKWERSMPGSWAATSPPRVLGPEGIIPISEGDGDDLEGRGVHPGPSAVSIRCGARSGDDRSDGAAVWGWSSGSQRAAAAIRPTPARRASESLTR